MRFALLFASCVAFALISSPALAVDCKEYRKGVAKAMAEENNDAAVTLIQQLGNETGEGVLECLYDIGLKFAFRPEVNNAVLAQFRNKGDDAVKFFEAKYDENDSRKGTLQRRYISTLLIGFETESAVKFAGKMLEDEDDRVQTVAVRVLVKSKQAAAIGPLIDLLEELTSKRRTRDILYYEVRDGLYELTLEDFELLDDWRRWWKANEASFDPKKIDDDSGATKRARPKKDDDEPEVGEMPIQSKHLVFVIDTSGSMRYVEHTKIPGLASGDGSDGGGASGGGQMSAADRRLAQFWTRMEMAKRELYKVVYQLDARAKFNLFNFDNGVNNFKKRSVSATGGNKRNGLKWVDGLKSKDGGATNTIDALTEAFEADPNTNTIYFLSDGLPSKDGRETDEFKPILDKVFELNRFRRIKVHTFGFDPRAYGVARKNPELEAANDFLRTLSESTGGEFTEISCKPSECSPDQPFGKEGLDGRGSQGGYSG